MPEKCYVHNCTQPAIANGLCRKHYVRERRHGHVEDTRPADWGRREKHPAYSAWSNLRRHHLAEIPESWQKDFWAFVQDVPEKPERSQTFRPDPSQPWSKSNFYWKELRVPSHREKEYMREWHRKARAANPDYYLSYHLRKKYGVTLEWYRNQFSKQGGVCAICKKPETATIKGKTISMAVDHCHKTHKVRGLLCTACNRGLGLFSDSIEVLESAAKYIAEHAREE